MFRKHFVLEPTRANGAQSEQGRKHYGADPSCHAATVARMASLTQ